MLVSLFRHRVRTVTRTALWSAAATLSIAVAPLADAQTPARPAASFTLAQMLDYPFTAELAAAPRGSRIAWTVNLRGVRNVWTADGPGYEPRQITSYTADDGQELTNVSVSPDGQFVVYVRGGDHDANWDAEGNLQPNPSRSPAQPTLQIWVAPTTGAVAPRLLTECDAPVISPRGDRMAFIKNHQVWTVPLDGSSPAKRMFFDRGEVDSPTWSPNGDRLAFVSRRGDHSFIGIFAADSTPIEYLAPSTSHDDAPVWSPDGTRIAFVRLPGSGGTPEPLLDLHPRPWSIWVADAATGVGHRVWQSPNTLHGSYPTTAGQANLAWGTGDRLVFLADLDGWPHLYSIAERGDSAPLLLTPGQFMVEYVTTSPDHRWVVYNANIGTTAGDVDRRHLFRVPVDRAAPVALTPGEGLEWAPVVTGDGRLVAFISATSSRPSSAARACAVR